jgi:hypothetical protein
MKCQILLRKLLRLFFFLLKLPSSKLLLVGLIVFLSQAIHFFLLFQENILAKCLRGGFSLNLNVGVGSRVIFACLIYFCTDTGELYTWGWKECVPLGKFPRDGASWGALQKDNAAKQNVLSTEQGNQVERMHFLEK